MSTTSIPVETKAAAENLAALTDPLSVSKRLRRCATAIRDQARYWKRHSNDRPAVGTWLVDNGTFLLHQIRELQRSLPACYLRILPRIGEVPRGELRVYRRAVDLLSQTGGVADAPAFATFAEHLAQDEPLTISELWALGSFLRFVLIERLHQSLNSERAVSQAITGLRALEASDWRTFVESNSILERLLRQDPAGIYAGMDFETRDMYRSRIEGMGRDAKLPETAVAEKALELARAGGDGCASHVGYFIVGPGAIVLERLIGVKRPPGVRLRSLIRRFPNAFYLSMIVLAMAGVVAAFGWISGSFAWWTIALLLIPASQAAIEIVNTSLSRFLPPRTLPSMDFSSGIPDHAQTLVVVPTLLLSESSAQRLLENLEIRYLANRDRNLFFALLTDFPDSEHKESNGDGVLSVCEDGLKRLNSRYGGKKEGPFYLFHRPRRWNASECTWMGHERKRGKLNDLNRLLRGRGNSFSTIVGDVKRLARIQFVITLDTDTQLPRETAAKMIAAAAHPLNAPKVDPETGMVREGFAVIRPRVTVSMESAGRSRLAKIFSGQAGFDPYATSVSDIYQDLYGQASFTGKGIYDVEAFDQAVGERFPDNAILSHDLIEGEYARTGLLSGVELVEDCPVRYEGFAKRKHRWVRGDWQLLPWLLARVPSPAGVKVRNPLPLLSRWKIFDNLRRSSFEMGLLILFFAGWIADRNMNYWTSATLALLAFPAAVDLILTIVKAPERRFLRAFAQHFLERAFERTRDILLTIVFLPHDACVNADAIVRTLVRRYISQSHLLEWETMAQSEGSSAGSVGLMNGYLYASSAAALLLMIVSRDVLSGLMCALWMAAPAAAFFLNQPPLEPRALSSGDRSFLRSVALRTWRFFADHSTAEQHWLVPDNIQEDPPLAAHRISPTNLGLQLTAYLAALDFGYLTTSELVARLRRIMEAVRRMPRYEGHLFNWYDTRTLEPELPRFVSSVDSGNLAASLCVLRQSCRSMLDEPAIGPALLDGLRDHVLRLRDELPYLARSGSLMRPMAALLRQLETRPDDLFHLEAVLTDIRDIFGRAHDSLERTHQRLRDHGDSKRSEELGYWQSLLSERIESALAEMYRVAPWLEPSIEAELRLNNRDPRLAALFEDLCCCPALASMPATYERIRLEVLGILNTGKPPYPSLRSALEKLLRRLPSSRGYALGLIQGMEGVGDQASRLFDGMNFRFLFDPKRKLLRIGYHVDQDQAEDSHYDLLASEARTAVFIAIAKGEIPRESWFRLGRKLTAYRNRRTLISWSGTMFEYLMPLLHMRNYENTLLGRGMSGAVEIQRLYAHERKLPWGISEAAYSARDERQQYQYHAFGVPALSSATRGEDRPVVAPYASMLALMIDPAAATENLSLLAARGCVNRYGFYESIDYGIGATDPQLIRCFMSHHQGMGLLAIDNALLGEPMQKRFHSDPLVQATEFLLQERMPVLVETLGESEDAAA